VTPDPAPISVPDEELDRCNAVLSLLEKLHSPATQKLDGVFFEFKKKWGEAGIMLENDFALLLQCSLIKLAEVDTSAASAFGNCSTHHRVPSTLPRPISHPNSARKTDRSFGRTMC
jgi:hypothetical protein